MRPSHIEAILDREFASCSAGQHTPVMLWGPPGVGKSQIIADIARKHGVPLIDIRLSQMEPTDLRGIPFRKDDNVEWSVPAMLPDAARHGEQGILFLDEINAAPPTVSAAAYQLILDRRLGEYVIPDGWAIFAAGNRQGDRGVTYTMPAPLANRFSHFEVETHLDDWVAWAYAHDIDERVIAFLRFRPERLFDFDPAHNPIAFPSPRSWEFAHRGLRKFEDHPELLQAETLVIRLHGPDREGMEPLDTHPAGGGELGVIGEDQEVPVLEEHDGGDDGRREPHHPELPGVHGEDAPEEKAHEVGPVPRRQVHEDDPQCHADGPENPHGYHDADDHLVDEVLHREHGQDPADRHTGDDRGDQTSQQAVGQ